jgi:ribosome biogenesis GTPase A
MAFVPRTAFHFPTTLPSWYSGHMARAVRIMDERMSSMSVVIEVRDARLPLTSINPLFERLVESRKRLIVYCKRDIADPRWEEVRREKGIDRRAGRLTDEGEAVAYQARILEACWAACHVRRQ